MSARAATTGVFFVNGAAWGVWAAQIPFVQERFELSKSALGLVLLAMSVGVILAMLVAGQAAVRLGSARATRLGAVALCLVSPLPLLAPEVLLLPVALLVFGAASAIMDVSMNAHGAAIERTLGRPVMSSLHAGWSFGGFAGAGAAGLATVVGVDSRLQPTIAAALLLAGLLACLPALGPGSATAAGGRFRLPSRDVVLLAALCFLIMVTEGAMADWGGVYLRGDLGASATTGSATSSSVPSASAASAEPERNSRIAPSRRLSQSPVRRPIVIPAANAANVVAASPALAPRSPRR